MAVVIITGSQDNAAGAGDIIPGAINFNDVTVTVTTGIETTNEVTFSALSSPIVVRAAWTSTSANPAKAYWMLNGGVAQLASLTPVEVTVINGSKLQWRTYAAYTWPAGNYDTGTVTVTNETRKSTVTITIATPGVVTWAGHGFSAGDKILFRTTGALPTGITAGVVYYVSATDLATDTFKFSATDGGAVINTSGSQSGTHTAVSVLDTFNFACHYVYDGGGGGSPDAPDMEEP